MRVKLLLFIFFFAAGVLCAQENNATKIHPSDAIQDYMSGTKEYAALFNGKVETPYDRPFANHPYLETDRFVQGTLCYDGVVYQDVFMRLDLYRDELTVYYPERPFRIVLENENFSYAVLNGFTIIAPNGEPKSGPKYILLVHGGLYPVVKQYRGSIREEFVSTVSFKRYFRFQEQYFVYINETAYPVKNKKSLLKLFPDRKKELNEYARQHRLNFRSQFEQSAIALVNHYENLTQ
jgi:hypothetical protein